MKVHVRAGQVYRAKAKRGHRYVLIEQVRGLSDWCAYALAREVSSEGELLRGHLHGLPRDVQMRITLTYQKGEPTMPPWYELHEQKE